MAERRRHPRVRRPLDGSWRRPSGDSGPCRIADISAGGCFIESLAMPMVGEACVITAGVGEHSMSFKGTVRYVEQNMGFAVEFEPVPPDQMDERLRFIQSLATPASHGQKDADRQ